MLLAIGYVPPSEYTSCLLFVASLRARKPAIQLIILLPQSSRPSRVSEAEPYLRVLLKSPTVVNDTGDFHRINATLHLAGALASSALNRQRLWCYRTPNTKQVRSQLDEAHSLFFQAFSLYDTPASATSTPSLPPLPHTTSFARGFGLSGTPTQCLRRRCLPPKTELWARASYIQLLRRLNDEDEANRQLELIRCVPAV